jgi:hypothetical protein
MLALQAKMRIAGIPPAILNLDLASISRLNLELFNHKGHQMGPTLKEEIQGLGGEIMKEGLSG